MVNRVLLFPAVMIQSMDMLTMRWESEFNPIVNMLGSWAFVVKALLMLVVALMAWRIPGPHTTAVLLFAITVGLIGVYTNVA